MEFVLVSLCLHGFSQCTLASSGLWIVTLNWDRLKLSCALKSDKQKKMNGLKKKACEKENLHPQATVIQACIFKECLFGAASSQTFTSPHSLNFMNRIICFSEISCTMRNDVTVFC